MTAGETSATDPHDPHRPVPVLRCPAFTAGSHGAGAGAQEAPGPAVEVWAFCYNRRPLLPYFLAHYRRFARRIQVIDNASTDGSREWLAENGVILLDDANAGRFDDRVLKEQKNSLWKASRGRADWVVVCDVDELVHVSDLSRRLAWCGERGVSCIRLTGFDMVSDELPVHAGQLYDRPEFCLGAHDPLFSSKIALFRPDWVSEINYREGAHEALPEGRGWLYSDDTQFALLHYKFLGGEAALAGRCRDCAQNLTAANQERGQSLHFLEDESQIAARVARVRQRAAPLFPPLY